MLMMFIDRMSQDDGQQECNPEGDCSDYDSNARAVGRLLVWRAAQGFTVARSCDS